MSDLFSIELYDRPRFSNMSKFAWWSCHFSYHQRVCNLREFSNSYETAHRTENNSVICRRQCKTELKKTVRIICCYVMSDAAKFENPNTGGFCAKSNTAVITDSVNNTNLREEKGLSSEKIKSTDSRDNLATLLQERIIINSSTALKQWEQLNISVGEHTENAGSCLGKFAQG